MAPPTEDNFRHREEVFDITTVRHEQFSRPADASYLHQILRGFGSRSMLIIGISVLASLALSLLAFSYWPAAVDKKVTKTAKASAAVQSAPVSAVQSAPVAPVEQTPRNSELTFVAPPAVAWPDISSSGTVAIPQVTSATPMVGSEVRRSQNRNVVFVQRPGVNVRSAGSANGTVVATAPKGKRFKVSKRQGEWVQVESDSMTGWIKSEFLAPTKPQ